MFPRRINELGQKLRFSQFIMYAKHTNTCPSTRKASCPTTKGSGSGGSDQGKGVPKRAPKSGACRMGFLPNEWFLFFYPKTGVSGPYVFGLVLANYMFSKEIYVMEHEYYIGLSIALVVYLVTTKFGPGIGKTLDKEVDAVVTEWESGRKEEISMNERIIKESKDAQWRAEGQQVLMEAKKENVAMQLEAEYRERCMVVYRTVKGRMDYHVKKYYAEARIHQKWLIDWVLNNVTKAITPEFEQRALDQAIKDLGTAASKA